MVPEERLGGKMHSDSLLTLHNTQILGAKNYWQMEDELWIYSYSFLPPIKPRTKIWYGFLKPHLSTIGHKHIIDDKLLYPKIVSISTFLGFSDYRYHF